MYGAKSYYLASRLRNLIRRTMTDLAGAGEKAAAVREASYEDVEDAESKGQVAKAHIRIV